MRFQGNLYRALNPVYAREPLSGRGAELHGGRFNPKGMAALYTSLTVMTALREANQVGNLQPITLVSYEADIERVFDTRDEAALAAVGMDAAALSDPSWRDQMKKDGKSATQKFAETLIAQGFQGMLIRSFAPGATKDDLNLIVWTWADSTPSQLILIDDQGRLEP
jgi:RES domain-containing protein